MAKSPFRRFGAKLVGDGFIFHYAPQMGLKVINKTGTALAVNKVVAITTLDATSKRPKVVLADSDLPDHNNLWVTLSAIGDGKVGIVYKGGLSTAVLDTNSATTVGDAVYLSGTAGAFVHTADFTKAVQPVGFVAVKSATVGQIYWSLPLGQSTGLQDTIAATMFVPGGVAAGDFDGRLFQADRAYEVVAVREQHQTAGSDAGAVTVMVKKAPSGTAKASGTDILAAGINLKATADTIQSPALHATATNYQLAAGDSLGLVTTGTLTAVDGVSVTVYLKKI